MMLVPYFLLTLKSFGYLSGLGANPVETIIHETGLWGLRFLMLTLLLTPIAYYSKIPSINKLGKPVGLMAFFYLLNHFLTYAMIDQAGDLGVIIVDIIETPIPFKTLGILSDATYLLQPGVLTFFNPWITGLLSL